MIGDAAWPTRPRRLPHRLSGLPRDRRRIRLPVPQAALLNASMGHALDFDDTLDTGGSIRPGVSVLVSVLAARDSLEDIAGEMSVCGLRCPQPSPRRSRSQFRFCNIAKRQARSWKSNVTMGRIRLPS